MTVSELRMRSARLTALSARARRLERVRTWLPRGNTLHPRVWALRHRLITRFALIQAALLGVFAACIGQSAADAAFTAVIVAVPALIALVPQVPRTAQMVSTVISLMFASAMLVDVTNGLTESHFHFFVMLGVVSLYQDWTAFGVCLVVIVLHHAVMGFAAPSSVFATAAERANPVKWALIHGAFVLAASITHLTAWRAYEQQELRDSLTQLPNRAAFAERLLHRLTSTRHTVSVLFVDIDDFKTINDSGGHAAGDRALQHAAAVIEAALRGDDLVARIGGDEFAVLLTASANEAEAIAHRVQQALTSPILIDGRQVYVSASIGVADSVLAGSREPEDLLRDADLAMYLAKSAGKQRVVTYNTGVDRAVRDRAALAHDLQRAVEQNQFVIHYQPVMRYPDLTIRGVEALVRWQHPERGLVPPADFIPLAEETGCIKEIGAWVLRAAIAEVGGWQRTLAGCEHLELAVNLSPAQLRDTRLPHDVADALRDGGMKAECLTIEVTESMLLSDLDVACRQLDALRAMGASVAIDDFGTGYSSLSYLARLPADQVKIDRSFVQDVEDSTTAVALVRAIVDMAGALDLDVQAEGVETAGQEHILTGLGCPRAQGFLYSRPLPAEDFASYMSRAVSTDSVTGLAS